MDRRPFEVRFRIFGIPIGIEPSFWIGAVILGLPLDQEAAIQDRLARLGIWVAVVLVGILVHELGHAVVARVLGARATVRLYAFGGVTFPDRRVSRLGDVIMSLAGPSAGFLLAAAVWGIEGATAIAPDSRLAFALQLLREVTVVWGIFNLFPIPPLDGGHILAGLLGPGRQRLTLLLGGLFAVLGAVASWLLLNQVFLAILFGFFAVRNFQARAALRPGAPGMTVDDALARAWQALTTGNERDAERLGRLVLDQAPDPDSRNRARDLLAWACLAQSNRREALRHLERSEPPEAARAMTWAMVLEAIAEPARALPYALRAFEDEPSETSASLAMRLLVHEKRHAEAHALAERFVWPRPGPRAAALAELASAERDYATAARAYETAFEHSKAAVDAYNAACSHARAGDGAKALRWVEQAVEAGFRDGEQLAHDPDLAPLRSDPQFVRLVEALGRPARQRESMPKSEHSGPE